MSIEWIVFFIWLGLGVISSFIFAFKEKYAKEKLEHDDVKLFLIVSLVMGPVSLVVLFAQFLFGYLLDKVVKWISTPKPPIPTPVIYQNFQESGYRESKVENSK